MAVQNARNGKKNRDMEIASALETLLHRSTGEQEAHLSTSRVARWASELLGSFLLFLGVYAVCTYGVAVNTLMIGVNATAIGLAVGLIYAAVSFIFGKVSGADLNPAVSLANVILGRIDVADFIAYLVMQCAGAYAAAELIIHVLPLSESSTTITLYGTWVHWAVNGYESGSPLSNSLYQMTGSSDFTFTVVTALLVELAMSILVIAATVRSRNDHGAPLRGSWLITGAAYAAGTIVAYPITGAALNPARATGIAVATYQTVKDYNASIESGTTTGLTAPDPLNQLWVFWVAPLLAAAVVAIVLLVIRLMHTSAPSKIDVIEAKGETVSASQTTQEPAADSDSTTQDGETEKQDIAETLAKSGVTLELEDDTTSDDADAASDNTNANADKSNADEPDTDEPDTDESDTDADADKSDAETQKTTSTSTSLPTVHDSAKTHATKDTTSKEEK